MKKTILLALLAVCLLGTPVFAASKLGGPKVGAQLGYGSYSIKVNEPDISTVVVRKNGGFYFTVTGECPVTEIKKGQVVSAKVAIGLNTMGKLTTVTTIGGSSTTGTAPESSPVDFVLYGGAEYGFDVNKSFALQVGAGLNMLIGKIFANGSESTNCGIGLAAEAVGAYHLQKNLDITAGVQVGWQFANTSDFFDYLSDNAKVNGFSAKFFAGATYSL